jgi:catalase
VKAIEAEKAVAAIIGTKVGGVMDSAGKKHAVDMALNASPSIFFDSVAVLAGPEGDKAISQVPDAVNFLRDACRHLKAIGVAGATQAAKRAEVVGQLGVTDFSAKGAISEFINLAKAGRVWDRDSD